MTKEAAIQIRELREKIRVDLDTTFELLQKIYLQLDGVLEGMENVNNTLGKRND